MAKELMSAELVMFDVEADTALDVMRIATEAMDKDGRILNKEGYVADVMARESRSSTAVGFSLATPHAKSTFVKEESLTFIRLKNKIKWDDSEMVDIIFQIGVPSPAQGDRHLEILAALFRKITHADFREKLINAKTSEEIINLVGEV